MTGSTRTENAERAVRKPEDEALTQVYQGTIVSDSKLLEQGPQVVEVDNERLEGKTLIRVDLLQHEVQKESKKGTGKPVHFWSILLHWKVQRGSKLLTRKTRSIETV